jgi:hypothetical protein
MISMTPDSPWRAWAVALVTLASLSSGCGGPSDAVPEGASDSDVPRPTDRTPFDAPDAQGSNAADAGGAEQPRGPVEVRIEVTGWSTEAPRESRLVWQDGEGPFTHVPSTDGVFRLRVSDPSGRYSVAVLCDARVPVVFHRVDVAAEGDAWSYACGGRAPGPAPASVTVSAINAPALGNLDTYIVNLGMAGDNGQLDARRPTTVNPLRTAVGTQDLVGVTATNFPVRPLYVVRDLAINGNTTIQLDLSRGLTPVQHDLVLQDPTGDVSGNAGVVFVSKRGATMSLGSLVRTVGSKEQRNTYRSLPEGALVAGDQYVFDARAFSSDIVRELSARTRERGILKVAHNAGPTTLVTPSSFIDATAPEVASRTAATRLSQRWTPFEGATQYGISYMYQSDASAQERAFVTWNVVVSARAAGVAPAYTMPDLSGVSEWPGTAAFPAAEGGAVFWSVEASDLAETRAYGSASLAPRWWPLRTPGRIAPGDRTVRWSTHRGRLAL